MWRDARWSRNTRDRMLVGRVLCACLAFAPSVCSQFLPHGEARDSAVVDPIEVKTTSCPRATAGACVQPQAREGHIRVCVVQLTDTARMAAPSFGFHKAFSWRTTRLGAQWGSVLALGAHGARQHCISAA